jgi:hypothetical protein
VPDKDGREEQKVPGSGEKILDLEVLGGLIRRAMGEVDPPIESVAELVGELRSFGYGATRETVEHWLTGYSRMRLEAFLALMAVLDIGDVGYFADAIAPEVWSAIAGTESEKGDRQTLRERRSWAYPRKGR